MGKVCRLCRVLLKMFSFPSTAIKLEFYLHIMQGDNLAAVWE